MMTLHMPHFLLVLFLTQIERDTLGMLQCHPYPNEYVDPSKPVPHTAFFMGLQRKQGVPIREGQQFDIRGTVEEFRHSVNLYDYWKPGMEIFVSHVRRKQIPLFVFPDGVRPMRPQRQQAKSSSPAPKASQSLGTSPPTGQEGRTGDEIKDTADEGLKRPVGRAVLPEASKRSKTSVSNVFGLSSDLLCPSQTTDVDGSLKKIVNVQTATVNSVHINGLGSITVNGYNFEKITSGTIPSAVVTDQSSRVTLKVQAMSSQIETHHNAFVDELEVCRCLYFQLNMILNLFVLCS